jgi:recombination protein RecR
MNPIDRLTELFEKFPGIGPRQARRFVHYLLTRPAGTRAELARAISELGDQSAQCKSCFRWFVKDAGAKGLCGVCASATRERATLFVVEKDADIEGVERSGYRGLYFVLGGTVPLAAEEQEKFVRMRELVHRAEADAAKKELREIILGLSATTEGDHTRLILQEKLQPLAGALNFKLSSLGRGLSTGSELEYADPDTIASALNSRN